MKSKSKATSKIVSLKERELYTNHTLALEVLGGLSKRPKAIPSKYLYDDRGSQLFEQIIELDEYYLTYCEAEILIDNHQKLLDLAKSAPFRLVELGVGDARKTKIILQQLLNQKLTFEYLPIDYCGKTIKQAVQSLKREFASFPLHITGLIGEYSLALSWLKSQKPLRNIVLFLGASIGNLSPQETRELLLHMWNILADGDCLLIGFDLKKDINALEEAYNDRGGLTEQFNLNLLERMNRELDANFDRSRFQRYCFYNPVEGRVESWLVSKTEQSVVFGKLKCSFDFEPWEGIHVENSYKYSIQDIKRLTEEIGFIMEDLLFDSKGYMAEAIWKVEKAP